MRTIKVRAAVCYDVASGQYDVTGWGLDGSEPAPDDAMLRGCQSNLDGEDTPVHVAWLTATVEVPEAFVPCEVAAAIERRE